MVIAHCATLTSDPRLEPLFAAMYPAAGHVPHRGQSPMLSLDVPSEQASNSSWNASVHAYFASMYPRRGHVTQIVTHEDGRLLLRSNSAPLQQEMLERAEKARLGSRIAHISKIEMVALANPVTAAVCFFLSVIIEPEAFGRPNVGWEIVALYILALSSMVLLNMVLELKLVQLTSAFALSIASVVHNVIIVCAGVLVFGETLPELALVGFALTNCGVALYAHHKSSLPSHAAGAADAGGEAGACGDPHLAQE